MNKLSSMKRNIVSLYLQQGANYIIPFITLPYLVRVLGPEQYGLMAFAQSFTQYFVLFTDYGFNLSATRQIAINRDNKTRLSEIFCTTLFIKITLMVASFSIMTLIVILVPKFRHDWTVYFFAFLLVPGQVIFPVWFFQGIEQMKYITICNITARLLSAFCLFVFVHTKNDCALATAIQSGGFLVSGILAIAMVRKIIPFRLVVPPWHRIKETLMDGWHVFISTASISFYTTSNTFVLGLLTNNRVVGLYSAADKIITAVRGLLNPIAQSIYPRINVIASKSKTDAILFIRKCLIFVGALSLLCSCVTFIFAGTAIHVLLGITFDQSINIIRIMSCLPFLIAISNILGIQTMLTFGLKVEFSKILIFTGIINLVLLIPLSIYMAGEGAALSVVITEFSITLAMAFVLHSKGYRLFKRRVLAYEG